MLTNVVRGPICHAFSNPEQAGLTPRSEQMPIAEREAQYRFDCSSGGARTAERAPTRVPDSGA